jgi:hypothetical protein
MKAPLTGFPIASGHANGFGPAVKCQDSACQGTVVAQRKSRLLPTIRHELMTNQNTCQQQSHESTLALDEAASSGFATTDGGKMWKVSTININTHAFSL